MIRKTQLEVKENPLGGEGIMEFNHILTREEISDHGKIFAHIVIKPKSYTKWHHHIDSKEIYYVLSGNGNYTDVDGSVHPISKGDVCCSGYDHWHCVENCSETENLEVIALILNKPE